MEPTASFNNFDYAVMGIILFSGVLALMRGLMREAFSLISWTGAFIAATRFYPLAEPWTQRYVGHGIATVTAGILVFVITFVILSLTGSMIMTLLKSKALSSIDRSLGFIFGLIRGTLIVCLTYLLLMSTIWTDLDVDTPAAPPFLEETHSQPHPDTPSATSDKDKPSGAPEWIIKSKTRPFLTYGAHQLKELIPEKEFEKKTLDYLDKKKDDAQKLIDDKGHDIMNAPSIQNGNP